MTYAIAQYLNVRQAFHPSFSSGGARLVFLTNITGDPQVRQIAPNDLTAIPWPDQITFETDRVLGVWSYKPAPSSDQHLPVIVYVHGGPEAQFQPYFHFFIQCFVHHGYAVFAPNARGSTGYGKAYSHLDDIEKRMDSVADPAHAALWLRQQPDLDGDRLVVGCIRSSWSFSIDT